jgi:hypothetical protein
LTRAQAILAIEIRVHSFLFVVSSFARMDLVTVYRTYNPAEAQLIRSRLDAAGLAAEVINENAAQDLGIGVMNVMVQVPDSEAEEAREIIKSVQPAEPSTDNGSPGQ